jgi:quinol monooxygenase YgiN
MYLRLVRFNIGSGNRAIAQGIADDLVPQITAQHGCASASVFGDDASGDFGLAVFWESTADAEAAAKVISPQLQEKLAGHVVGAPDMNLFEVLAT